MQHALTSVRRLLTNTWPSAIVAVAAWISIVIAIDPAGSYPNMPEGPGLTVDEIFNVEQGVLLVEQARSLGWLNLVPGTSVEAFKPENQYLPDHPPLGRYWLGVHHHLTWWLAPPFEPEGPFVTACARTGSATAFALTVWLIGAFVALRRNGREPPVFPSGGRNSLLKNGCREGEAPAEPRETSDIPHAHGSAGATPSLFQQAGKSPGSSIHVSRGSQSVSAPEELGDSHPPLGGDAGTKWEGLFASLALVLMPRLYGHAHIASLETTTNLTCTAAVLAVAHWWSGSAPPSRRVALLTGIVMGLALLTKIQAILIPIPVIVWALWRWRTKAILPLLVWGVTANVVFFALWPYLWLDPIGHFLEYLGRTTNRSTINCFYFGVRYADKAVPWHYPFVMFAVTVPLGLHLLGAWGAASSLFGRQPFFVFPSGRRKSPGSSSDSNVELSPKAPLTLTLIPQSRGEGTRHSDWLLLACTVFPLIVFALPGVAVYDGERLFLTSFPLWAIFVGRGMCRISEVITRRANNWLTANAAFGVCLVYLIASQEGIRPANLCYYNELTFGQAGAERWGLELDYWGVGVTRGLLSKLCEAVPHGSRVAITPTLHQFQTDEYRRQSPILRKQRITLVPYESLNAPAGAVLVFRRRADVAVPWTGELTENIIAYTPSHHEHDDIVVWLAYIVHQDRPNQHRRSPFEDRRFP